MIRFTYRLAAVAVLAVFAAAALADGPAARDTKGPKAAKDVEPVKVPFDLLKTQHMTVMVKVNGAGPFRLIFDTGAPVTLLSNKVAKAGGLHAAVRVDVSDGFVMLGIAEPIARVALA